MCIRSLPVYLKEKLCPEDEKDVRDMLEWLGQPPVGQWCLRSQHEMGASVQIICRRLEQHLNAFQHEVLVTPDSAMRAAVRAFVYGSTPSSNHRPRNENSKAVLYFVVFSRLLHRLKYRRAGMPRPEERDLSPRSVPVGLHSLGAESNTIVRCQSEWQSSCRLRATPSYYSLLNLLDCGRSLRDLAFCDFRSSTSIPVPSDAYKSQHQDRSPYRSLMWAVCGGATALLAPVRLCVNNVSLERLVSACLPSTTGPSMFDGSGNAAYLYLEDRMFEAVVAVASHSGGLQLHRLSSSMQPVYRLLNGASKPLSPPPHRAQSVAPRAIVHPPALLQPSPLLQLPAKSRALLFLLSGPLRLEVLFMWPVPPFLRPGHGAGRPRERTTACIEHTLLIHREVVSSTTRRRPWLLTYSSA
ncbi:hypothetical protein CALCODRAFT_513296 [Calocera cornea HHB12733]|uniref:Uncharacterized protein n=1 Tax=Calocera cornea HHB12733 TaxID=1353952 RepID=A0A165C8Z8_9BASI|nr:hypothetical protein CALCODRAFT_513296 [Calocera cornea HHB12733]